MFSNNTLHQASYFLFLTISIHLYLWWGHWAAAKRWSSFAHPNYITPSPNSLFRLGGVHQSGLPTQIHDTEPGKKIKGLAGSKREEKRINLHRRKRKKKQSIPSRTKRKIYYFAAFFSHFWHTFKISIADT